MHEKYDDNRLFLMAALATKLWDAEKEIQENKTAGVTGAEQDYLLGYAAGLRTAIEDVRYWLYKETHDA